jgi:hypothetical protein
MATCKLDSCERIAQKAGFCEIHYRRFLKYGNPEAGRMIKGMKGKPCTIDDCTNGIDTDGLCKAHYYRRQRYGDPTAGAPVLQKERICIQCGNHEPEGRASVCAACHTTYRATYHAKYYQDNRERQAAANNRRRVRTQYGEAGVEVEKRRQAGEPCDICGRRIEPMTIDHCHVTGVIRGLLCKPCNFALGNAGDDPARLRAMADYLDRPREAEIY